MKFELDLETVMKITLEQLSSGYIYIPELVKALVEQGEKETDKSEDRLYDNILEETYTDDLECVVDAKSDLQDDIDEKATEISELEEKVSDLESKVEELGG